MIFSSPRTQILFKSHFPVLLALLLIGISWASLAVQPSQAQGSPAFLLVNLTTDANDANPGDGVCDSDLGSGGEQCTLRAAISEANALAGPQIITVPNGIYTLSLTGVLEDANASGDLDITSDLTLRGANANTTIIQAGISAGSGVDRVFHVLTGTTHVTLQDVTIRYGTIPNGLDPGMADDGGGILNSYTGLLTVTRSILTENIVADSGEDGGGIANIGGGTVRIFSSTISSNQANNGFASGGGLFTVFGSHMLVQNSIISGNQVSSKGGGVYLNRDGASITLIDSTIQNNTAANIGGGIQNGSIVVLTNTTISGNKTALSGGGISNDSENSRLYAHNVTIAHNTADSDNNTFGDGGGLSQVAGSSFLLNTLLGGNHLGSGAADDCEATNNLTASHSLVGTTAGCILTGSNTLLNVNPVVAPIGNYGGASLVSGDVPHTVALLPGSPAIDSGDNATCSSLDQRGVGRVGTCDIGAFESQGFGLSLTGGNGQTTDLNSSFPTPLQVTATANVGGEPVEQGVVTFQGPTSGASLKPTHQTAVLNGGGQATLTAIANSFGGSYQVSASAAGASSPVQFNLTNNGVITLTIAKTVVLAHSPAQPGDVVTYTVIVSNSGTHNAPSVRVQDTLPSGVSGSNLDQTVTITAGQVVIHTMTATVTTAAGYGATVTNTATYSHEVGSGSDTASFTTLADTTAPVFAANALISPTGGISVTSPTPTFSWKAATDSQSGVLSYTLLLTRSDQTSLTFSAATNSFVPATGLANGVYTWTVQAHDAVGNASQYISPIATFTIDMNTLLYLPIVTKE